MLSQNKPYDGLLITLEGGEGSGKTSVAKQLFQRLQNLGHLVVATREPGGSCLSDHIRDLILHPSSEMKISEKSELFLFLTARVQHIEEQIGPDLRAGKIVLCDRFNDSTIAYQGFARHLGKQYVETLCNLACENITPDITLFLDIDPDLGLKRVTEKRQASLDRLEKEFLQFHQEVRQGFLHLADEYPHRIHIIDASLPLEEVVEQALAIIMPRL